MKTRLVLTRGDARDLILTMGADAALHEAAGVKLTARVNADDDDTVWAKDQDDMALTAATASYTLTAADWTAWEAAGEPTEMEFDWEVTPTAGALPTTQGRGTIVVEWDVSR